MRFPRHFCCTALAMLLAALPTAPLPAVAAAHKETVWNYDGGVYFATEGSLEDGACFRLSGRVTAPGFFDHLRRIDRLDRETVFQRGNETVTKFPDQLILSFVIFDFPCELTVKPGPRVLLTRERVASLRLNLFWKHGLEQRPTERVSTLHFSVDRLAPQQVAATDPAVQQRFEWFYGFAVPSADVPVTDSLVIVVRSPEGRIAARVAARM